MQGSVLKSSLIKASNLSVLAPILRQREQWHVPSCPERRLTQTWQHRSSSCL